MAIETKRALIVVRTYPTPAKRGVEVSCTAAITDTGEWLRLFPVPYRFLSEEQQFRKYQWVDVRVERANDARPESYKLAPNAITIISQPLPTADFWRARKNVVFPLKRPSLCAIKTAQVEKGFPTLGVFKPGKIKRLLIEPTEPSWSAEQLAILRQQSLFHNAPIAELEKVPFDFRYEFSCDAPACEGHSMICTDWELGQSWRNWSKAYGDEWADKFRQRYEQDMMARDTHFYVGTVHQHPKSWIIVGLFYPPYPQMGDLFDTQA